MLLQRLSLEVDDAARRSAIFSYPRSYTTTMGFGGVFAGRRLGQIRIGDVFGHSCGIVRGVFVLEVYSYTLSEVQESSVGPGLAVAKRCEVQHPPLSRTMEYEPCR